MAAVLRLWSVGEAPFGPRQAAALVEAQHLAGATAIELWANNPGAGPAGVVHALFLGGGWVEAWVVVLCFADAVAAVLIFVAARTVLGAVPGMVAGGLYAVSPWAWSLARDPASSGLPVLGAATLAVTIGLVRHPSLVSTVALATLGALLVRADPLGLLVLPLLAVALVATRPTLSRLVVALAVFAALAGPVLPGAVTRLQSGPVEMASDGAVASLRFWRSVADAAAEGTELAEASGLTVLTAEGSPPDGEAILAALLPDLPVRQLPPGVVSLPIERSMLYLSWVGGPADQGERGAVARPAVRLARVPLPETEVSARLTALRPRPVAQWLAGVPQPTGGDRRFADGSTLVGALVYPDRLGQTDRLELYWRFEPAPDVGPTAAFVDLRDQPDGSWLARAGLPDRERRRTDELVVQTISLARPADSATRELWVALTTDTGGRIVSEDGRAGGAGDVQIGR